MGYMHIDNLYKNKTILNFRECYALEKVHGSSAHVAWRVAADGVGAINLFAGGESHERFKALFDVTKLFEVFTLLGHRQVTVYGEVYGGKCQGMSDTYGKELRFIAFDVQVGETWLNVLNAEDVVKNLGLEFVPYWKSSTDAEALNKLRDQPSVVAARRGIEGKSSEGVVLRPLEEFFTSAGHRVIAKHKGDAFKERVHVPLVDAAKLEVLSAADAVATEWVTEMRLGHVLAKLPNGGAGLELKDIPLVGAAMVEDVYREAKGEIVESREVERAIRSAAAKLFKRRVVEVK